MGVHASFLQGIREGCRGHATLRDGRASGVFASLFQECHAELDVAWSRETKPLAAYLTSGQIF